MSAIFGIVRLYGPPVMESELTAMSLSLKHRGPDGVNQISSGAAGLGHCMLYTTTESLKEVLPFHDEQSGLVITADARIDNRTQLISDLKLKGPSGEITDSQLILAAYKKWGEKCVTHLLGDFAFAIWHVHAYRIFCARDHIGNRPFYYSNRREIFALSSSAKAIAALPGIDADINQARIGDCLLSYLEGIDNTVTFFNGVSRLPPGSTLTLDQGGCRIDNYWQPTCGDPIIYKNDDDYLDAFDELFEDAVKARLRSHMPVGVMLSGGVDSSAILGYARKLQGPGMNANILSYSAINLDDPQCRETAFIKKITDGYQGATFIQPDEIDRAQKDLLVWHKLMEDPFDQEMIIPALVYRQAASDGVRVMLDGGDGDIVASICWNYLPWLIRNLKWRTAWIEARGLAINSEIEPISALPLLASSAKSALLPMSVRVQLRKMQSDRAIHKLISQSPVTRTFSKEIGLAERLRRFRRNYATNNSIDPNIMHQAMLRWPAMAAAAERYERTASAWTVEARQPLLDKRVIEFFLNLPVNQKVRNGWSKHLLRRAAARVINPDIAWQKGRAHVGGVFHSHYAALADSKGGAKLMTEDARIASERKGPGTSKTAEFFRLKNLIEWETTQRESLSDGKT